MNAVRTLAALLLLATTGGLRAEIVELTPIAGIRPVDARDEARLRGLVFQLADWKDATTEHRQAGLTLSVRSTPDALAWLVATRYLELRKKGKPHAAVLADLQKLLPRWKRYEGQALILLAAKNEGYRRKKPGELRIFTLEKSLEKESLRVLSEGRRLPARLAGLPEGIRSTRLRQKKFWRTRDGVTRRPRSPDDPGLDDPNSIGRQALLSDPFPSALIEGELAELKVLVPQKVLRRVGYDELAVSLSHWKKYEGPFDEDIVDLNRGRPWQELDTLELVLRAPAGGLRIRHELARLVAELRQPAERPAADPGKNAAKN